MDTDSHRNTEGNTTFIQKNEDDTQLVITSAREDIKDVRSRTTASTPCWEKVKKVIKLFEFLPPE
jgi:hypothetical protein